MKKGKLYLVPTSITQKKQCELIERERDLLKDITVFIVEDEKNARANIKEWNLEAPLQSLVLLKISKRNISQDLNFYFKDLEAGKNVVLMTDAGMPAIADPGENIVREAHKRYIEVVPLVGPSSIFMALAGSGLDAEKFKFNGYLPINEDARIAALRNLEDEAYKARLTQIFMETPYRNFKLWQTMMNTLKLSTDVSVAIGLMEEDQIIRTGKVADWKDYIDWPDFNKYPAIFMIS